jgi:NAD(P)-dependent dehydrogenase (short-subunit alcohol dehydrogenase family)
LAAHGARVILACRDIERGKQAADKIIAETSSGDAEARELDLADMASVRVFAEQVDEPVHLLVNNAGVMAPRRRVATRNGFELQFGTNHLGHFALTGLMLPQLLDSADARVVTVSSLAHRGGQADLVDGNVVGPYHPRRSYSNSKLANLLFALELQRRAVRHHVPLASVAAHPGLSATGLFVDPQGLGANPLIRVAASPVARLMTQSAAAGAQATLFACCAAAPGSYVGPQRMGESRGNVGLAQLSPLAQDTNLARELWHVSEELTGLRYPWPSAVG